jgi:hypothetical protein
MDQELTQAESKESYEQPRLATISLRPEEAVLGHCKNASSAGPAGSTCVALITPCGSFGS